MQPMRRSALVVATSLIAAGFMAACGSDGPSPTEPRWLKPHTEGVSSDVRATISLRGKDGTIRSITDTNIVSFQEQPGGGRIIKKGGKQPIDPKSAVISQDDGSMTLQRMEGLVRGRTGVDAAGNKLAIASFGGQDGAPPELSVFYRNGKPLNAFRSTYTNVNGKLVVTASSFVVYDTLTGKPRGEIAIRGGDGRAFGPPGGDLPSLRSVERGSRATVVDTPTTQQFCESAGWCDKLFKLASVATATANLAFDAYEVALLACWAGVPGACDVADAAYNTAIVTSKIAEKAWYVYYAACRGQALSIGSVDPADGDAVTSFIERNAPQMYDYDGDGCDDDTGNGGGDDGSGGGALQCHDEWGKIEISYDGGWTWYTLWEGPITVCEYAS